MDDIEKRAREIDPMAWTGHALTMSDTQLRAVLADRRAKSIKQAEREVAALQNEGGTL